MFSIRLADLAQQLNAQLHGDGDITIAGLASMSLANSEQITFLSDSRYREKLTECQAAAVVLTEADLPFCPVAALVVKIRILPMLKWRRLWIQPHNPHKIFIQAL